MCGHEEEGAGVPLAPAPASEYDRGFEAGLLACHAQIKPLREIEAAVREALDPEVEIAPHVRMMMLRQRVAPLLNRKR